MSIHFAPVNSNAARCRRWSRSAVVTAFAIASICTTSQALAQFIDHFDRSAVEGWEHATGDGHVKMELVPSGEGYASIVVDGTEDRHNIWWALIKHEVSGDLDLEQLNEPHHELRIETRIRVGHAPRRVNLHVNTQRTTDFHSHLMEFDIPDTTRWHTISMTTRGFDARPGDDLNAQMALIDWGLEAYRVDVDYFRVDVIDTTRAPADEGEQVAYHPPVPPLDCFAEHMAPIESGMIDLHNPDINFSGWHAVEGVDRTPVLTVDGSRYILLRWDLEEFAGREIDGYGVLTLTTHSLHRAETEIEELGQIRIVEIFGGDPKWSGATLTLNGFTGGRPIDAVVNGQMVVDVAVAEARDATTHAAINRSVLQRLIDGKTRGLMIRPLGPISASFYKMGETVRPELHFNLDSER